jgi:hypothetical protein
MADMICHKVYELLMSILINFITPVVMHMYQKGMYIYKLFKFISIISIREQHPNIGF